jgi:cobalamin synthase
MLMNIVQRTKGAAIQVLAFAAGALGFSALVQRINHHNAMIAVAGHRSWTDVCLALNEPSHAQSESDKADKAEADAQPTFESFLWFRKLGLLALAASYVALILGTLAGLVAVL